MAVRTFFFFISTSQEAFLCLVTVPLERRPQGAGTRSGMLPTTLPQHQVHSRCSETPQMNECTAPSNGFRSSKEPGPLPGLLLMALLVPSLRTQFLGTSLQFERLNTSLPICHQETFLPGNQSDGSLLPPPPSSPLPGQGSLHSPPRQLSLL